MGLLDAPGVSPTKNRIGSLLNRMAPASTLAIPAVAPASDIPTVAWNTTSAFSSGFVLYGPQGGQVTEVGSRGSWNSTFGRLPVSGLSGLDFYHDGTTTVEIQCNTNASSAAEGFWVWVNGAPIALTHDTTGPNTSGVFYVLLTFPSVARRRIEFFAPSLVANWYGVRAGIAGLVTPSPRKPVVAFVGDSFWAGSAASAKFQSGAFLISRLLGVEGYSQSIGGTGYVNAGGFNTFGSTTRVNLVSPANPELIVIQGSVNDDGLSGIQAAATAAFAAYAAACPKAKIVVFGPEPSAATVTIGATRQASIAAVAAAASAAPNVLAFHDMCGTQAGVPAAFSTSTVYNDGDLCTSLGSVWKLVNNGATSTGSGSSNAPGTAAKWALQTYCYTGTGKVGSTVGDGTRDAFLYSDGVHPMPIAGAAMAIRQASVIRDDLRTASQ